ncbi:MAG: hypothetical protein AAF570_09740, partial [Bacteroidota bacterium]
MKNLQNISANFIAKSFGILSLTLLMSFGLSSTAQAGGVVVKNGPKRVVVVKKKPNRSGTVVVVKKRNRVWVPGHW